MPVKKMVTARTTIAVVVGAVAVIAYLLLKSTTNPLLGSAVESDGGLSGNAPQQHRIDVPLGNLEKPAMKIDGHSTDPEVRRAKAIQDAQFQANRPLKIFARIVDQHEQPIPGVRVQIGLAYYPRFAFPAMGWNTQNTVVESDEKGEFSVENQNGVLLTIGAMSKSGVQFNNIGALVVDARGGHSPLSRDSSPIDRILIRGWKNEPPSTRISYGSLGATFKPDGRFVPIDFDKHYGERDVLPGPPQGDLYVAINEGPRDSNDDFEWSVTIRAISGGIQEHDKNDLYPYVVPATGYLPEWTATSSHGRGGEIERRFFLKTRDGGRYSEIHVWVKTDWQGDRNKALISLHHVTNLDGARDVPHP